MITLDRELTHAERVDAFRGAITQIRTAALQLVDAELFGASDEVGRCIFALERQIALFSETDETQRMPEGLRASREARLRSTSRRLGRGIGIDVIPGSVKQAREEAGLSLAEVAGTQVTRVAIWYIEAGRTRPSLETLRLIADRTGKDVSFFTGVTVAQQLSLDDAVRLRDEGIAQVLENADGEYRHRLYRAIQECAATGTTFSADHVRALAGEPPEGQSSNIIGAVFNHAAKAGLIQTVGFTRSAQIRGHANTIRLYRGAA